MQITLTRAPGGQILLASPYDRDFVEAFKQAIPYASRAWNSTQRRWVIDETASDSLRKFCLAWPGATVQDLTEPSCQPLSNEGPDLVMPADLAEAMATLYLSPQAPIVVAEASYKALAKIFHSDIPTYGDTEKMQALNTAIATIRQYLLGSVPEDDIPF